MRGERGLKNVSIIIPSLNGGTMLQECLCCLEKQSFKDFEVILADNASTDGSPESAKDFFPGLKVLRFNSNLGFAAACARALETAQGQWIAVLNNDAFPETGWLEESLAAAASDETAGMVAPRVIGDKEENSLDSLGMLAGRNGMSYLAGHGDKEDLHRGSARFQEVFGAPAVAALYSKTMLDEIGFFEKDYFAYYEDVDISFRARWAGWKCILADRARVRHMHSETSETIGLSKTYYLHRNRLRTIIRDWPAASILKNLPFILLDDALSFFGAVYIDGNLDAFRARVDFARALASDLRWRSGQAGIRRAHAQDIDKWLTWRYPSAIEVFRRKRSGTR